MTDTFEQKKRLSERQFTHDSRSAGSETTPNTISDPVLEFAKALGGCPQLVPVKPDRYGLYAWCADGVNEKVKHDGGRILFGWTIWEWPDVMLTAEFHSIWSNLKGDLVDITPKPQGERSIVFVVDRSYPQEFNFDKRPTNRRRRILDGPNYSALALDAIARMKPFQLEYETKRAQKKRQTLVEWMTQKQPKDLFPPLIDRLIQVCHELERKMDSLNPGGGSFSPDREYLDLSKKKVELLTLVQSQSNRSSNTVLS